MNRQKSHIGKILTESAAKKVETKGYTEGCSYAYRTEYIPYVEWLTKLDDREVVSRE